MHLYKYVCPSDNTDLIQFGWFLRLVGYLTSQKVIQVGSLLEQHWDHIVRS